MRGLPGLIAFLLSAGGAWAAPAPKPPQNPASPQDKNAPLDGVSQFNKARDLAGLGDLAAAIEAYKAIPPTHPSAPLAAVQIRELQGKLARQGRGKDKEGGDAGERRDERGGEEQAAGGSAPASSSIAGRLQRAFGMRGRSPTLNRVIEKAGRGRAASFADLERAGIKFELGAAGQKDAVQLSERDGKQVLTLHPAVFQSGKDGRVAAQMGRGLEEAATQRDYEGVSQWLRKAGGRLVAVKVLIEVAVEDALIPKAAGPDQRLLNDREVVAKSNALSGEIQLSDIGEGMQYIKGFDRAKKDGFQTPINIFLYFGANSEGGAFSPRSMPEPDKPYVMTLLGAMP